MPPHNVRKKSRAEVKEYRKAVKSAPVSLTGTIDTYNSNLAGSNELSDPNSVDESEALSSGRLPIRTRIRRFAKKYTFEVISSFIIAVLVALVGWYGITLINLKIDYAVFSTKLEDIDSQIEDLEVDSVTREILDIQLDALEQEILHGQEISKIEIENRIDLIERQIALIQNQ